MFGRVMQDYNNFINGLVYMVSYGRASVGDPPQINHVFEMQVLEEGGDKVWD